MRRSDCRAPLIISHVIIIAFVCKNHRFLCAHSWNIMFNVPLRPYGNQAYGDTVLIFFLEPMADCAVKTTAGECCVFPFKYKSILMQSCITDGNGNKLWCSTTSDYDQDGKWGNCDVTQRKRWCDETRERECVKVGIHDNSHTRLIRALKSRFQLIPIACVTSSVSSAVCNTTIPTKSLLI